MLKRKPFWIGIFSAVLLVVTGIALTVLTEWQKGGIEFSRAATPTPDPLYELMEQRSERRQAATATAIAQLNPIFRDSARSLAATEEAMALAALKPTSDSERIAVLEARVAALERIIAGLERELERIGGNVHSHGYGAGGGYYGSSSYADDHTHPELHSHSPYGY